MAALTAAVPAAAMGRLKWVVSVLPVLCATSPIFVNFPDAESIESWNCPNPLVTKSSCLLVSPRAFSIFASSARAFSVVAFHLMVFSSASPYFSVDFASISLHSPTFLRWFSTSFVRILLFSVRASWLFSCPLKLADDLSSSKRRDAISPLMDRICFLNSASPSMPILGPISYAMVPSLFKWVQRQRHPRLANTLFCADRLSTRCSGTNPSHRWPAYSIRFALIPDRAHSKNQAGLSACRPRLLVFFITHFVLVSSFTQFFDDAGDGILSGGKDKLG